MKFSDFVDAIESSDWLLCGRRDPNIVATTGMVAIIEHSEHYLSKFQKDLNIATLAMMNNALDARHPVAQWNRISWKAQVLFDHAMQRWIISVKYLAIPK